MTQDPVERVAEPATVHGRYVLVTSRSHGWPAFDVNDILLIEQEAALRAIEAAHPEGLDVERLAQTFANVGFSLHEDTWYVTEMDLPEVAAEYARLSDTPTPESTHD